MKNKIEKKNVRTLDVREMKNIKGGSVPYLCLTTIEGLCMPRCTMTVNGVVVNSRCNTRCECEA